MSNGATIRDKAVRFLAKAVDDYADWACESGLYLPPDYATDPAGWAECLRSMQRAFNLMRDEENGEGELWEARMKKDDDRVTKLEDEIKRGFENFGKHLFFLTDEIIDRGPTH